MINPYRKSKKSKRLFLIALFATATFSLYLATVKSNKINNVGEPFQLRPLRQSLSSDSHPYVPTLRGKKVFFAITTVGLGSFSYLEDMIDSVRDLCEAGAQVSLHVISSNCDANVVECEVKEKSGNDTLEDNFSVETISHLNERVRCRNPEGSLKFKVHLVSPDWGKQICDHHRLLFYENIKKGYDVFIHTEDDQLIRPAHIIAFMHEMEKLRELVGDERLPDYCIGFIRYENQNRRFDNRRVVWEFDWDSTLDMVNHSGIENKYFTSPPMHHQGMSMAIEEQLIAWKTRQPDCHYHKIERRPGYHRERITGGLDLYDPEYCNVTQLLPLDSLEDFLIHHLPNKNYQRMPLNVITTMNLHKMRINKMQSFGTDKKIRVDNNEKYNGIEVIEDERDPTKRMHFNITDYHKYVEDGGRLTKKQLEFWEWEDKNQPKYYEREIKYY